MRFVLLGDILQNFSQGAHQICSRESSVIQLQFVLLCDISQKEFEEAHKGDPQELKQEDQTRNNNQLP